MPGVGCWDLPPPGRGPRRSAMIPGNCPSGADFPNPFEGGTRGTPVAELQLK